MVGTAVTARRAATIFLPVALLAGAGLFVLFQIQDESSRSLAGVSEARILDQGRLMILTGLANGPADLRYLAAEPAVGDWLDSNDPARRQVIADDYLVFAREHPAYDQIRLIDAAGQEIVRIDRAPNQPRIVPDAELENKTGRPYVDETLKLGRGQVYESEFDLNVEHGAIEQPLKPTIRFATPIFDGKGRLRGVTVLSYLGQPLLDRLKNLGEGQLGRIALLDRNGYWLLGPNPADEWAFMYPDRQARSFANDDPEAWKLIRDGDASGNFYSGGNLYTYVRLGPAASVPPVSTAAAKASGPATSLVLLSTRPIVAAGGATAVLRQTRLVAAGVGFVFLAVVAWAMARQWTTRQADQEAVHRSEARFRGLIESAPDAVIVTDRTGTIVIANAQTKNLFGFEREELIGKPIETLVPERLRPAHIGHRIAYQAGPHTRPMRTDLDLRGLRRDGSEFSAAISLSPIVIEDDTMIFCDIRDITVAREAEGRIKELNQDLAFRNTELETVNRELESFSYSVSHDLRAPLRAIDGFSQALLEDVGDRLDGNAKAHLNRIRGAAQRMGLLIDDLLQLARVTRAELAIDRIDLSKIAGEVVDELKNAAPDRRGEFTIAPDLLVDGDPRLMRVVLENLLNNAWKFTAKRDTAKVDVGRVDREEGPAYYVRDNGAGFDMNYAGKLFGVFQRLHDAGSYPGTGVGLATVQRIIRKHGGDIWADAKPEGGATFYFTLAA
jgi:PAS domain S-box-containing protein